MTIGISVEQIYYFIERGIYGSFMISGDMNELLKVGGMLNKILVKYSIPVQYTWKTLPIHLGKLNVKERMKLYDELVAFKEREKL